MSNKGTHRKTLNLYCQKKGIDYPIFQTCQVDGESHKPIFQGKVIFNHKEYKSERYGTKCECEEDLAKQICIDPYQQTLFQEPEIIPAEQFNFVRVLDILSFLDDYRQKVPDLKLLLIDIENVGDISWEKIKKYNDDYFILVVKSKASIGIKPLPKDIKLGLFIADTIFKDGADTIITMLVASTFTFVNEYIIITQDHFATTIKSIVDKEGINLKVLPRIQRQ